MTLFELIAKIVDLIDRRTTFNAFMAVSLTVGLFGLLVLVIFHPPPATIVTVVFSLISAIGGYVGAIVQFKYGSSASSAKKDDAIIATSKKIGD